MQKHLQDQLDAVALEIQSMLDQLNGITDSQLNSALSADAWSAGQVMWHVIRVLEVSVDYIAYKSARNPQFEKANYKNALRSWLLKMVLRSKLKFKAPTSTASVPETVHAGELQLFADIQLKRLRETLERIPDSWLPLAVFKHPRAGRMTVAQMLAFMLEHTTHHHRQINRILLSTPVSS